MVLISCIWLADGHFYPDIVKYKKLCQKAKYKEYKVKGEFYIF